MKIIAIGCIKFYQKFISPHKGFRCAYGVLHGGKSCSGSVIDIINKHGVFSFSKIRGQFQACHHSYETLISQEKEKDKKKKKDKNNNDNDNSYCHLDGCSCVPTPSSCKNVDDCGDCGSIGDCGAGISIFK
jgi:putative component of membrane protein insertase Oxa1/YidC/SpoIIIJ protein YidD